MNKTAISVIIAVLIIVGLYIFNPNPWKLVIHSGSSSNESSVVVRNDTTIRMDYPTKEKCLSGGASYISGTDFRTFDCKYKIFLFW